MSDDIPDSLIERLAKLLEMLGSEHAGERAAAGAKAHGLLRSHGLTITQVLTAPRLGAPVAEIRQKPMFKNAAVARAAADLLAEPDLLVDWEFRFLRSMAARTAFTEKQQGKVAEILERIRRRAA